MKGDIGIEKQVEQEAAYPIPISCYRTVRYEKRYQEYNYSYASRLMPHCPLHLEEMIFVLLIFGCDDTI